VVAASSPNRHLLALGAHSSAARPRGNGDALPIEANITARLPVILPVVDLLLEYVDPYAAVPEMPPGPVT
jgi:hypothetical protein